MREFIPLFLDSLQERNCSPRTVEAYRHKLGQLFDWLGDQHPTPQLLHKWRLQRQQEGRRPRTIRVDLTAAFAFFDWLRGEGWQNLPPRGSVKPPRMDLAIREAPTDEEVETLFDAIERMPEQTPHKRYLKLRARAILTLLCYAGLRRAEVLALNASDIRQEHTPWYVHVREGKGAQPRMVELGAAAQDNLAPWLELRREWCYRHGHKSDALFPINKSKRMSHHAFDTAWKELLQLAGLGGRKLSPHGCRHYYGTKIQEAVDLKTAQEMLGHKKIETTAAYLHTTPAKRKKAAEAFGPDRRANEPPKDDRKPDGSSHADAENGRWRRRRLPPGRD